MLKLTCREIFKDISIDAEGERVCNLCEIWAIENINDRYMKGDFSAPLHANLTGQVFEIGDSLKQIYAATYQVLPFVS